MKILKKVLLVILSIVVLAVIVSFFLPSKAHVERTSVISAPVEIVFGEINCLKNWGKWSPWDKLDTAMRKVFEGPECGVGSKYSWESDRRDVGKGNMVIKESQPNAKISIDLDFSDNGKAVFNIKTEESNDGTKVTWSFETDAGWNPIGRYFGLIMDKMVGPDLVSGLISLKAVSEAEKNNSSTPKEMKIETMTVLRQDILTAAVTCKPMEIGPQLGKLYGEIGMVAGKNGLKQAGPMFAIYNSFSPEKVDMEAGMVTDKPGKNEGNVKAGEIKAGNVVVGHYYGSYDNMEPAHKALQKWVEDNHKKMRGAPWESYVTDPGLEKNPNKVLTEIYYPIE